MKVADMHHKSVAYRKTSVAEQSAPSSGKALQAGKKDVMGFSHGATGAVADKATISMKAGIHSYLAAPATGERLESLRQSVKDGTYRIETEDIVDAILGFERAV